MSDLEDDEDGPCPNCEDGCERCDPRFLFTDEDREALRRYFLLDDPDGTAPEHYRKALDRMRCALAYIDHLEGALREIAKTSCFGTARGADSVEWRDHQKIARAALVEAKDEKE